MSKKVSPIPAGYHSITPYLIIKGAAAAIEFYKQAFNAKEIFRLPKPDGKIMHAEIQIGDSKIMLADECPEMQAFGPTDDRAPILIHLYVDDVDATFEKAVAAGAKVVRPLQNQFYGDRSVGLTDPFGHYWGIATHIEDVSAEEIEQRLATTK